MAFETITLQIDGAVATLMLNRPERMNALNDQLKAELGEGAGRRRAGLEIDVLIITGAGERAFCAGADIKERSADRSDRRRVHSGAAAHARSLQPDRRAGPPVIAAINGVALGGGMEIALCCDVRLAADTARLGLTEVNLGVIPAGGGTQRLPRLIGAGRAKRLIMIGSGALRRRGRRHRARGRGGAGRRACGAGACAGRGRLPPSRRWPSDLRRRCVDQGAETDLKSALEYELYAASILYASEDRKEGMRAFLEKRKPVFKGR